MHLLLHLTSGPPLGTFFCKRKQPYLGQSLPLLWGWFCHGRAYPPLGAPSRHEVVEVELLFHWLRSHLYPNSTWFKGDQVMAISLVTWMVSRRGLCLMLPSLPGLLSPLVMWVCGLPSRVWLQTFSHPSHWILWPLTWQLWPWTETPDSIKQFGCKGPGKKWRNYWVCTNCILSMVIGIPFICHQWTPSQIWGHFWPGKR